MSEHNFILLLEKPWSTIPDQNCVTKTWNWEEQLGIIGGERERRGKVQPDVFYIQFVSKAFPKNSDFFRLEVKQVANPSPWPKKQTNKKQKQGVDNVEKK